MGPLQEIRSFEFPIEPKTQYVFEMIRTLVEQKLWSKARLLLILFSHSPDTGVKSVPAKNCRLLTVSAEGRTLP